MPTQGPLEKLFAKRFTSCILMNQRVFRGSAWLWADSSAGAHRFNTRSDTDSGQFPSGTLVRLEMFDSKRAERVRKHVLRFVLRALLVPKCASGDDLGEIVGFVSFVSAQAPGEQH